MAYFYAQFILDLLTSMIRFLWFVAVLLSLASCKSSQPASMTAHPSFIQQSAVWQKNHTGFALADAQSGQLLEQFQAEKYFTPASNTKLFTYFASVMALPDTLPALKYAVQGDSLLVFPTGDPTFWHPDMPANPAVAFLQSWKGPIFIVTNQDQTQRWGPGWAWDDYNDYYQADVGAFPLFGNIVRFQGSEPAPRYFQTLTQHSQTSAPEIRRALEDNTFVLPKSLPRNQEQDIPFRTSENLSQILFKTYLQKEVKYLKIKTIPSLKALGGLPADTVYRRMLQVSDNMLAEQLMVMVAGQLTDTLSVGRGIEATLQRHLSDLADAPRWVDGSGLSRYNLFTPRSLVQLLQKTWNRVPQQRLLSVLPSGGQSGTLSRMFKGRTAYIFAKSGSLSGVYNLSGYLQAKSGRWLAFSLMQNNFVASMMAVKQDVQRLLEDIAARY
jgi:serine-type D-Ala-D-Ala carboxypeptidase/endopeptidase (penicillin-binding protein 4)